MRIMKRYILLVVAALCATSCWDLSNYVEPNQTTYARSLYNEVLYSTGVMTSSMQVALWLDEWITESDSEKKFELEYYYFSGYKINDDQADKIIMRQNYENYDDVDYTYTITGCATSIYEVGTVWEITRLDGEQITITCTDEKRWSVTSDNYANCSAIDLDFKLSAKSIESLDFNISGVGSSNIYNSLSETGVDFNIEKTLSVSTFIALRYFEDHYENRTTKSGKISFSTNGEGENRMATATYEYANCFTISYRGFSDKYYSSRYIYDDYYYDNNYLE